MYRKANNVYGTILSDVTILTSTLPAVGSVITKDNIPAGAVVMVDAGMRRTTLGTLANGDKYHIVQGRGANTPLMKSAAIAKGTESISIQKHVPAQQQISAIGYAGSGTGFLPSANDTSYYIKVRKNDNDEGNRSQPFSLFGQYKTGGAATQLEVALGLASNLAFNMAEEAPGTNGYLNVEVLTSEASAADATATTIDLVNGERAGTLNAGATTFVVGDLLRIGGGATTDEVYEIVALSGTAVTLDRAFTGATGTGIAIEFITAAAAAAGTFGIRLVGVVSDFSVDALRNYFANRFTATFNDSDIASVLVQGARNGSGVWQSVANDEYMNYGYEGQNEMISVPPKSRDQVVKMPGVGGETALTSKYSTINLKWIEDVNYLVSSSKAEGNVIVHLNLEDVAGSGELDNTVNTGSTLATALGLSPAALNE
jgi:hypothetical protein